MTGDDKKSFSEIMLGMADNFRDSITEPGMRMRFDRLRIYSIDQIYQAANKIVDKRKYTRMPPIAEFIEELEGGQNNPDNKALIIANEIISHLKTKGSSSFPQIANTDPTAKHLMTTRWKYSQWASTVLESEFKWWVKEFCEAYKAYDGVDIKKLESPSGNISKLIENIGNPE